MVFRERAVVYSVGELGGGDRKRKEVHVCSKRQVQPNNIQNQL